MLRSLFNKVVMRINPVIMASCVVIALMAWKFEQKKYRFSPVGYWQGTISAHQAAVLNTENGTRLYFKITGKDTAHASGKLDGVYQFTDEAFQGIYPLSGDDTLFLEANHVSEKGMFGLLILSKVEAVPFNFTKRR